VRVGVSEWESESEGGREGLRVSESESQRMREWVRVGVSEWESESERVREGVNESEWEWMRVSEWEWERECEWVMRVRDRAVWAPYKWVMRVSYATGVIRIKFQCRINKQCKQQSSTALLWVEVVEWAAVQFSRRARIETGHGKLFLFLFLLGIFFAVFGLYDRVSGKGRVDRNAKQAAKSRLGMKVPTSQVIRVPKLPIFTLILANRCYSCRLLKIERLSRRRAKEERGSHSMMDGTDHSSRHSLHYLGIYLNILLNISNRYHHHDYSLWIDSTRVGRPCWVVECRDWDVQCSFWR
jgi:hypothetical protein